jgi:hypothetical protein
MSLNHSAIEATVGVPTITAQLTGQGICSKNFMRASAKERPTKAGADAVLVRTSSLSTSPALLMKVSSEPFGARVSIPPGGGGALAESSPSELKGSLVLRHQRSPLFFQTFEENLWNAATPVY